MERKRTALVLLACLAAIALAAWIDFATGTHIHSVVLYLLPIVLVALTLPRRWAILAALLAAAAWSSIELQTAASGHPAITTWNVAAALGIFVLVGFTLSTVRREQRRLQSANLRIKELLQAEHRDARTDPLTLLPNRREFVENLQLEIARCRRDGKPLCLLFLDLDNFKQINDRLGHARGDAVLRQVGAALKRSLRASDVPARLGGDEFAALLWQAEFTGAGAAAERVLNAVREIAAEYPSSGLGASLGVAWFRRPPADPDEALEEADQAMYQAKQQRNKVVVVNVERDPTQIEAHRAAG